MGKIKEIFGTVSDTGKTIASKGLDNVSPEKISNNLGSILTLLILLMAFVDLRYECESKLAEISRLKNELNDVRYTSIERWGILTTLNNRVTIRKTVVTHQLNLIESDEPAVLVK